MRPLRAAPARNNTELLAVNAFTPIDDAIHAAMFGQWTGGRGPRIRGRKRCACRYFCGLRDLNVIHLETVQIDTGTWSLGCYRTGDAAGGYEQNREPGMNPR